MTLIIIGAVIAIIGLAFKFFPPKKINFWYGWRSRFSMKNQEIWDEAQRYGANLVILGGCALLMIGLVENFLMHNDREIVTLIAVVVILTAIFFVGENHLKGLFHKDGTRIS